MDFHGMDSFPLPSGDLLEFLRVSGYPPPCLPLPQPLPSSLSWHGFSGFCASQAQLHGCTGSSKPGGMHEFCLCMGMPLKTLRRP